MYSCRVGIIDRNEGFEYLETFLDHKNKNFGKKRK